MDTKKYRGILKTWKDEGSFGFIKPDTGTKEIFLHISAIKRTSRRPRVGDTIYYLLTTDENGKICATNAAIEGVTYQALPQRTKLKNYRVIQNVCGVAVMGAIALVTMEFQKSQVPPVITSVIKPGCNIKGNISIATGNKIYHVRGAEDYESTVIELSQGEKRFCTESEAIKNGWRKAPR